jgi:hypothetical protein
MSKLHFYELFNEKTDEFFKDLIIAFPNIEQFKILRSGFNLIKNFDHKKPQKIFNSYIGSLYKDMILTKNEEFFLQKKDFDIYYNTEKEYWESFINYLRNIWTNVNNTDKESIWKYLHILLILSHKCT